MEKKHSNQCICEEAVRYTYDNLIKQNFNRQDALQAAYEVLKQHHPEIPKGKISSKVFTILISN